jgi:hypothetical protein
MKASRTYRCFNYRCPAGRSAETFDASANAGRCPICHEELKPGEAASSGRRFLFVRPVIVGVIVSLVFVVLTLQFHTFNAPSSLPMYSWPPPVPSASNVSQPEWLVESGYLGATYNRLQSLLRLAGFDAFTVYAVSGDGFLIVTPPERVLSSGMPDAHRWQVARRAQKGRDWFHTLGDVFSQIPEGNFRSFVIAVTSATPSSLSGRMAGWDRNFASLAEGNYLRLPDELAAVPVNQQRLHVYLYYYERARLEENPHQLLSDISLEDHLNGTGLRAMLAPCLSDAEVSR